MKPNIWLWALLLACAPAARGEIVTRTVEYDAGGVRCRGFLAYDDAQKAKRPGVLVVPEWWGVNDFVRDKARAVAALGYVAFAADMYGEGRVTADPDQASKWAGEVRGNLMRPRAQAALDELANQEQVDTQRLGAIGFCFGGTTVLELAYSGADLRSVVTFHGGLTAPQEADMDRIKPEILILHGAADSTITQKQIQQTQEMLDQADVKWTMVIYSGAKHAFTNPGADKLKMPAIGYNERAAKNAWEQMVRFLKEKTG